MSLVKEMHALVVEDMDTEIKREESSNVIEQHQPTESLGSPTVLSGSERDGDSSTVPHGLGYGDWGAIRSIPPPSPEQEGPSRPTMSQRFRAAQRQRPVRCGTNAGNGRRVPLSDSAPREHVRRGPGGTPQGRNGKAVPSTVPVKRQPRRLPGPQGQERPVGDRAQVNRASRVERVQRARVLRPPSAERGRGVERAGGIARAPIRASRGRSRAY